MRAAIIWVSLCEMPPSSEANAKITTPAMKTLRRPSRSPIRPPSRSRPPNARVYALTTQDRSAWEKPRSTLMCGSAMFTIVPSSTTMSCAALMTASAIPRLRWPEPAAPASRGAAGAASTGSGSATSSVGWDMRRPFGQGRAVKAGVGVGCRRCRRPREGGCAVGERESWVSAVGSGAVVRAAMDGGQHELVDDAPRELHGGRLALDHAPEGHHRGDQGRDQVDVDVLADLPPRAGRLEDPPHHR